MELQLVDKGSALRSAEVSVPLPLHWQVGLGFGFRRVPQIGGFSVRFARLLCITLCVVSNLYRRRGSIDPV